MEAIGSSETMEFNILHLDTCQMAIISKIISPVIRNAIVDIVSEIKCSIINIITYNFV
jgi:hypothetical protein